MKKRMRWTAAIGAAAAFAWIIGCGGGGGGGGGGSQIRGSLSRSASVQTAALAGPRSWIARATSWVGARPALADGTTACGNPAVPADGVTVSLLLDGAVVQTTVTGADGEFVFNDVAPGSYVVQVTLPSGTISTSAIVEAGQATTLAGELDVDCQDVDDDGDETEIELHTRQHAGDGAEIESDETEDDQGGQSGEDGQDQDSGPSSSSGSGDSTGSTDDGAGHD